MSQKVVPIRDNLVTIAEEVLRDHKDAKNFIVCAFDDADRGGLHIYYKANDQEMSLASVRLAHLANKDK